MNIAIVGNGSLTEEQRERINQSDLVARFNCLENYRDGEKSDIIFFRCNPGQPNIKKNGNKFAPFTGNSRHRAKHDAKKFIFIAPHVNVKHKIPDICEYYNSEYEIIQKNMCKPPSRGKTWHSGYFGVHHILREYPEATLQLYGMNFPTNRCEAGNVERREFEQIERIKINETPDNRWHGSP